MKDVFLLMWLVTEKDYRSSVKETVRSLFYVEGAFRHGGHP